MGRIRKRLLEIRLPPRQSAFLVGPAARRQSYWIRHTFPQATLIDLLQSDVYRDYVSRPALLRERYQRSSGPLVIDEVQKVPALLDEGHQMGASTTSPLRHTRVWAAAFLLNLV